MSVRQLAQNRAWLTAALTVSTVLSMQNLDQDPAGGHSSPASGAP